jgi:hypothetical protein
MKKQKKHYLVKLELNIAGYEKNSLHLIDAHSIEEATEQAIRDESHYREDDTPPERGGWYEDAGGEFSYRVENITELDEDTSIILSLYL